MAIAPTKPATLEDFLRAEAEAPEGVTLELIDGEIVERPMTTRTAAHSYVLAQLTYLLVAWLRSAGAPAGGIGVGETRCRLTRNPDKIVGIDLGIWLGEEFVVPPTNPPLYDQPPTLAVEVLSPSDRHDDVIEKLNRYLEAGVKRVWIVDTDLQTISVHGLEAGPVMFNCRQTIPVDPALPGLTLAVADIFPSKTTHKSV